MIQTNKYIIHNQNGHTFKDMSWHNEFEAYDFLCNKFPNEDVFVRFKIMKREQTHQELHDEKLADMFYKTDWNFMRDRKITINNK